jgi:hypothetical protein
MIVGKCFQNIDLNSMGVDESSGTRTIINVTDMQDLSKVQDAVNAKFPTLLLRHLNYNSTTKFRIGRHP